MKFKLWLPKIAPLLYSLLLLIVLCSCAHNNEYEQASTPSGSVDGGLNSTPSIASPPALPSDTTPYNTIMEAFESALLNEVPIRYVSQEMNPIYQSQLYLDEITQDDSSSMSTAKFTVLDLDGDGVQEVVFERSDYIGFVILRYYDGEICGYDVSYRAMTGLKQDGSCSASGGAEFVSLGKIRFLANYYDLDATVYSLGSHYYHRGYEINRDVYDELRRTYEELPDVDWYDYTDDMVSQKLLDYSWPTFECSPTEMQNYLDSLADLLFFNYDTNDYQGYYDDWNQAMDVVYTLCAEKQEGAEKEALVTEQQRWLENRSLIEQTSSNLSTNSAGGDMTKYRTYELISNYFDDYFYS